MSQQEIRELQSRLRILKKAERKAKGKTLGHAEKKQGGAYFEGEHEYLTDPVAKTKRRMEIFRNAGGEVVWFDESDPFTVEEIRPANCQGCAETHLVGWASSEGNWHHGCDLEKKCDSAACALYVCIPWHKAHHNREVQFVRR